MSATVRVVFDGGERRLAAGLKVRNLLSESQVRAVLDGASRVVDDHGNVVGLGGALVDGAVLSLVPRQGA